VPRNTPNATLQDISYLKYFSIFAICAALSVRILVGGILVYCEDSYRQKEVHSIHQAENNVRNVEKVVDIGRAQQSDCDNVMRKHLEVVFSLLFDVNDQNLLHPE
jgi:hypothetical protein